MVKYISILKNNKQPIKTPFYYGWIILIISSLGNFFSGPGQTYSISVFINAYISDFGWSRTFVSGLYSAGTLAAGLLLFLVGRLVDKYGQRKMTVLIGLAMAFACLFNSLISSAIMLFLGFFLIRLFGAGSMTLTPGILVPQWFIKKRGLALSLLSIGGVVGSATLPPINTWIINNWGWASAWRFWAVALVALFVPLAGYLIRNTPEQIGLSPDGAMKKNKEIDNASPTREEESWSLQEALRTRAFWFILFCQAVPAMVGTGLTFHFISILGSKGIDATAASFVLGSVSLVSFPTMFLAGFMVDRLQAHKILGVTFFLRVISIILLALTKSVPGVLCFTILHGLLIVFEGLTADYIWPNYFGRKHLGSIRGTVMTVVVVASALGPLPFGYFFDLFGGYTQILVLIVMLPALASAAAFLSPKPLKKTCEPR